jgi:hypothetical protein
VEPGEAAWELLEQAVESVQNDMKRRMRAGMESAAEMLCQRVVEEAIPSGKRTKKRR